MSECVESPTGTHYWIVGPLPEETHRCKYCGEERVYSKLGEQAIGGFSVLGERRKARSASKDTGTMDATIIGLRVGETCLAVHDHLRCSLSPKMRIANCGLTAALSRLSKQTGAKWTHSHVAPHRAMVTRVL